jgi:hypothetical protein
LQRIPCTTVARTLLDLASVLDRHRLERTVAQAEVLQLFDLRALEDVLDRGAGRRGSRVLKKILDELDEGANLTESELEELFLALCLKAGFERPRSNVWVMLDGGAVRVDFLWPDHALIVEVDGRRVHGTRHAFERDRERDQRLMLAGYRVVRFTWKQITREPDKVVARMARLLGGAVRVDGTAR